MDEIFSVSDQPLREKFHLFQEHSEIMSDHFNVCIVESIIEKGLPFVSRTSNNEQVLMLAIFTRSFSRKDKINSLASLIVQ